jgi:hypothetical protein
MPPACPYDHGVKDVYLAVIVEICLIRPFIAFPAICFACSGCTPFEAHDGCIKDVYLAVTICIACCVDNYIKGCGIVKLVGVAVIGYCEDRCERVIAGPVPFPALVDMIY